MAALFRRHDRRGRFLKVVGVELSKKADEVKAERKVRLIHNARGARLRQPSPKGHSSEVGAYVRIKWSLK